MKSRLSEIINFACKQAKDKGQLPADLELPPIVLEAPRQAEHGDLACSLAMQMAKPARMNPRQAAQIIIDNLPLDQPLIDKVEIAGPGFINFFIKHSAWLATVNNIVKEGDSFGLNQSGAGKKVMVEYVSANPTGPLHVGHGRGAALGDVIARLLRANGYEALTEYYLNDAGNQMATLGRSVIYRAREIMGDHAPFPAEHYQGDYIFDLAAAYLRLPEIKSQLPEDEKAVARQLEAWAADPAAPQLALATRMAADNILKGIKGDLADFGIVIENYFSEKSLLQDGAIEEVFERLRQAGLLYESEGALWFASSRLGDDKDRVVRRGNGELTYFASDIAYHLNKLKRGFTRLIDVWGADHHGYVARVKAALQGLGQEEDDLVVVLVQMVRLLRAGAPVPMSTRGGQFVTLNEVVQEVGPDSARFIFLSRRSDVGLDFDLEVAKQKSMDNPVFYVQYAHTRVCSLQRKAKEINLPDSFDLNLLELPEEVTIAKLLSQYPTVVYEAALNLEPHRITYFLREVAQMFHSYYNDKPILQASENLAATRLALVGALAQVLKNGLQLLGITAPEYM